MAGNVDVLNEDNFSSETAKGVTLVDFYADWCGPCKMLAPILEELATEMNDKARIVKIDTDASGSIAQEFQIASIPTLILLKDGKEVKRVVGVRDIDALRSMIDNAL
ncbi:thioredoxin [Simkania negevensis]|uniref:Thioredoxin n=1 Tax=Simkania negevensis TaxID=83561 RepID=A0ABS3ARP9_9BACT|nr:thioredoxin [Simkania negevensis]